MDNNAELFSRGIGNLATTLNVNSGEAIFALVDMLCKVITFQELPKSTFKEKQKVYDSLMEPLSKHLLIEVTRIRTNEVNKTKGEKKDGKTTTRTKR